MISSASNKKSKNTNNAEILIDSNYEAAQSVSNESTRASANSAVQNTGTTKVKFKQWAKLKKTIGVVALAAVTTVAALIGGHFLGVYINKNAANENRADQNAIIAEEEGDRADQNEADAKENALAAYNNVGNLVANAGSDINKVTATYNTANNYVSALGGNEQASASLTEDEYTAFASMSTADRANESASLSERLQEAQEALKNATDEYDLMTENRTELEAEYDNSNWSEVNRINSLITENSKNIDTYTTSANEIANEVLNDIQGLIEEAEDSIAEAEEIKEQAMTTAGKLYAQLPSFASTVNDSLALIQTSISNIENYDSKEADEETMAQIDLLLQDAKTNQLSANSEKLTFDALYTQIESNYQAGNFNTVIELSNELSNTVKNIGNYATETSQDALDAAELYSMYQQSINDELSKTVIDVTFTQEDIDNYNGITKYLISQTLGGKVVDVDECTYNKNNGEVRILLNCIGMDGQPYTNLVTATIATGLTTLDPTSLIERIKNTKYTSQAFNYEMEIGSAGSVGEVSGDMQVQYSVSTSYNGKTGKTTVKASAIVIVKDSDGNISYKVYNTDPEVRKGKLTESDVQLEYEAKLSSMIFADKTVSLTNDAQKQ